MKIETKQDLGKAVLDNLKRGKENAIPGRVLADRLGERDTRKIRLTCQELREQGYPVIGDASCGYFIAENADECLESLEQLRSYLKMIGKHYKYLRISSRNLIDPYQIGMKL